MKSTFIYIALILSIFMGACSSDELENSIKLEENEILEIEAVSLPFEFEGAGTRTSITMGSTSIALPVWKAGDVIGIYPSAGGDQLSFPIIDGVGTNICVFTGGGWALKASTETTTYKYTAYTPFNRNYYQIESNDALPVSMLGQKQIGNDNSDHLGAYDLQIASGDTPTNGKISFAFQHKVAILRMDITAPCAATWKNITLKSDAEFTIEAAMDLSIDEPTVTPTEYSSSIQLDLENVTTTADNLSIVAYMMLLPVDFTGKTLTIELTDVNNNTYIAPVTFENPTGATNPLIFGASNARWISAIFDESSKIVQAPYLSFTADEEQTLTMSKAVNTLQYSVNGSEWTELGTDPITFGGSHGVLRLRGESATGTATGWYSYSQISFGNDVPVECHGDIRTLVNYKEYDTADMSTAKFCYLFKECSSLVTTPELPIEKLAKECYYGMFQGCSSLTTAPVLPATSLADNCYGNMFEDCSSLTTAPVLPATSLADYCYAAMFVNCINLISAPDLPATILAEDCYSYMFRGCSSLILAPELPATTLADYCYSYMFSGCESLTKAPELPATTLAEFCYSHMFERTSLKTAPELPATTLADYCYQYMFQDCDNLQFTSELPATELALSCYLDMFNGCTSLTSAPNLPAKELKNVCYQRMFYGCTGLTSAPVLSAEKMASSSCKEMFSGCTSLKKTPEFKFTELANECCDHMFYGCTSLETAYELPSMYLFYKCYSSMFSGCTKLKKAPKLPATNLDDYCYQYMFSDCTSLVQAPELPATVLENYCYSYMFKNCTSLAAAPRLPAYTLVKGCYTNMFYLCRNLSYVVMLANISSTDSKECMDEWLYGVSSTGTFIQKNGTTAIPRGSSGVPTHWTLNLE